MDLALDVGVSTRHLSFVETGRSRPSPELIMILAEHLDIPLRHRNGLLLAAGYAPRFGHTPIDDGAMTRIRAMVQQMLDKHDPYPGIAIDLAWNVVIANRAALRLTETLPEELVGPPMNVFRACLHPDGLSSRTANFTQWATYLLGQLHHIGANSADQNVLELVSEVDAYPNLESLRSSSEPVRDSEPLLLVPWQLTFGDDRISLFTTLTTFGTPRDITLEELAVELFYPADEETASLLNNANATA